MVSSKTHFPHRDDEIGIGHRGFIQKSSFVQIVASITEKQMPTVAYYEQLSHFTMDMATVENAQL